MEVFNAKFEGKILPKKLAFSLGRAGNIAIRVKQMLERRLTEIVINIFVQGLKKHFGVGGR